MSKSKALGTQAESAIVRFLQDNGYPHAERRALYGLNDMGDILVEPGLIIEAKVRHPKNSNAAVGQPGPEELEGWLKELDAEMRNAKVDRGLLVVKRKGTTNPGEWWAYARPRVFTDVYMPVHSLGWLSTTLTIALRLL